MQLLLALGWYANDCYLCDLMFHELFGMIIVANVVLYIGVSSSTKIVFMTVSFSLNHSQSQQLSTFTIIHPR